MLAKTKEFVARWSYNEGDDGRDLRFDFLRGAVLTVMIVVHIELFSLFSLVAWERVGVVSGAEGFVILAGVVVGVVYRAKTASGPFGESTLKMLARSLQLYRVHLVLVGLVMCLRLLPWVDVQEVTTFTDRGSQRVYPLLPPVEASLPDMASEVLGLRSGPHQTQVLGLYVVLMAVAPLVIFGMRHGRTPLVIGLSWLAYFLNLAAPTRPTGAQFEYAFPLLSWQVLFVHGLAVGYHRATLRTWATGRRRRLILMVAIVLALVLCFFAQNTPNRFVPAYARLDLIPASVFRDIYEVSCRKNQLGLVRLLNDASLMIVAYALLTYFWRPLRRLFGWFFIPMGQASLYVFILHLFVVLLASNVAPFGFLRDETPHLIRNTVVHAAALGALWLAVRQRFLFRWIPR